MTCADELQFKPSREWKKSPSFSFCPHTIMHGSGFIMRCTDPGKYYKYSSVVGVVIGPRALWCSSKMHLMYYLNDKGERVYTLKKVDVNNKPTFSAHPGNVAVVRLLSVNELLLSLSQSSVLT